MSDPDEVAGEPVVTPGRATVTYGKSDPARREAAWFIEGDEANNRPPRNFWGLTPAAIAACDRYLIDRINAKLS